MEKPIVSVLMTVYNRSKFICEAIESVIASSFQNWELIISDDKSNDDSYKFASGYALVDSRIKVYRNNQNLGDYPNRNKAASFGQGKYLKYLDSDDIIYPHGLEMMVNAMEIYPNAGIGFSSNNYYHNKQYPLLIESKEAIDYHFFNKGFLFAGPSGSIYRSGFFKELGGFRNYGVASDVEFNLRAVLAQPIVLFQRDLFYWRQHDDQEIKKRENEYIKLNHLIFKDLVFENPKIEVFKRRRILVNHKTILVCKIITKLVQLKLTEANEIRVCCEIKIGDFFRALFPRLIRKHL